MPTIDIIILAAGAATRFGSAKQLADISGRPMLQHVIESVISLGLSPYLALGAHEETILSSPKVRTDKCQIVSVPNWQSGMSASISCAMQALKGRSELSDGVIFLLGDQPGFGPHEIQKMLQLAAEEPCRIVCSRYLNTVGVPAFFPRAYFDELINLQGDRGAKSLLLAYGYHALDFTGCLQDIDRPEDINRLFE